MEPGRLRSCEPGRRAVLGDPHQPFTGEEPEVEVLAGWADGVIDITQPGYWLRAPRAIAAILADKIGWEAVRGPGPVTWAEALLMLQLEAERQVGAPMRNSARMARAIEDDAFSRAVSGRPN